MAMMKRALPKQPGSESADREGSHGGHDLSWLDCQSRVEISGQGGAGNASLTSLRSMFLRSMLSVLLNLHPVGTLGGCGRLLATCVTRQMRSSRQQSSKSLTSESGATALISQAVSILLCACLL